MKSIKELRKNNKKGFTLVELIVVLVILAILAALLIPTLTGYIDRAKEKDVIAQTRQTVMAAQTLVDEAYANVDAKGEIKVGKGTSLTDAGGNDVSYYQIADLAEVKVDNVTSVKVGGKGTTDAGKVTEVTYTNKGKTCTYKLHPGNNEETYNVK